tara:strand:+ start:445 stop:1812 length:1368 start_codon:yes stop_codon:yes gene_type:complete
MTIKEKLIPDKKVCILGLGYVGLTLAVTLCEIGYEVFGVEINEKNLRKLKQGKAHFLETGLDGRLSSVVKSKKLKLFKNIHQKFGVSVYIVTVGTPINQYDQVNRLMMKNVCEEISRFLKKGDLIILRSTVEVGTTEKMKNEVFDKSHKDYEIAFCPERTIEGKAMIELRNLPQIVGSNDPKTTNRVSQFFSLMTPTVVRVSSLETAELIKLIDNCQRDVNFALSNEIAEISDKLGVSAFEVINSGKLGYSRTNLPIPGPVGGPCLEKDSYILDSCLGKENYSPKIIMSSRLINKNQPKKSIKTLKHFCEQYFTSERIHITLAGMAFKGDPETNDLRGTMASPIIKEVLRNFKNCTINLFDPIVTEKELKDHFKNLKFEYSDSIKKAFSQCSLFIICNNHPLFANIPITSLSEIMKKPGVIFDYWNNFSNQQINFPEKIKYVGLGELGKAIKEIK